MVMMPHSIKTLFHAPSSLVYCIFFYFNSTTLISGEDNDQAFSVTI
jgi:hypothetical protein